MIGMLYIVATPIGNLSDITLRALETLKRVDAVLCEDTRVTGNLLKHYEIHKATISCHEHTDERKLGQIVARLQKGENFAFVSDAGTPGLSDPGNRLVAFAVLAGVSVIPIPGASALSAIVSVAGIDMQEFVFKGFPPHKKGRETFFKAVVASELPTVYYESPHRVLKNLKLLLDLSPEIKVVIGRELTKIFEEVVRGKVGDAFQYFTEHPEKVKGEFVIITY